MSTSTEPAPRTLFERWRAGDADAGQALAQRFTDWYYALSASRLGEVDGAGAFRSACQAFSQGVGRVQDGRRLEAWAHQIAQQHIHDTRPGGRVLDGDVVSAFTRKQSPKALLVEARKHLPAELALLEEVYGGRLGPNKPLDVLAARYALKRWLRQHLKMPFRVTPTQPDPDRAPLPWYEAGHMANETEDAAFDLYLLADHQACQDAAEFSPFAIALRGGLPKAAPGEVHRAVAAAPAAKGGERPKAVVKGPATAAPTPPPAAPMQSHLPESASASSSATLLIGGVIGLIAIAIVIAAWFFLTT